MKYLFIVFFSAPQTHDRTTLAEESSELEPEAEFILED